MYPSFILPPPMTAEFADPYSPRHCQSLESLYGDGEMSEGGRHAIEAMFQGTELHGKKALDIGSGLGGIAFYLAEQYSTEVIGIEVSSWLTEETIKRTPQELKDKLHFITHQNDKELPFQDQTFDIIYSKGALTHIADKTDLFREIYRLLKPDGTLIIEDWLSPDGELWGPKVKRLIEIDALTLFRDTAGKYVDLLFRAQFKSVSICNISDRYAQYNRDIVGQIKEMSFEYARLIEGYQLLSDAMDLGELQVIRFQGKK